MNINKQRPKKSIYLQTLQNQMDTETTHPSLLPTSVNPSPSRYTQIPNDLNEGDDSSSDVESDGAQSYHGTVLSSYLNITNTILGSGMLALPSALAKMGLGLGILLIALSAFASGFGLVLLTLVAQKVGRQSSFFTCSKLTYPSAAVFFDLAIAIKCFGVSISYLVICGDLLPKVSYGLYPSLKDSESVWVSKSFWVTLCILIVTPFSFARQLNSLRYTSAFALCAVIYLLFIVTYYYWNTDVLFDPHSKNPLVRPDWSNFVWIRLSSDFFQTLPIFVFAFTCHQNIFAVYNELRDNSPLQIQKVITYSIGTSFSVYQVVGILGYLTFGDMVGSNVISMYPQNQLITFGQLAIAILVLLSYPLQCHPCRSSLEKILSRDGNLLENNKRHVLLTLCILVSSYFLAIATQELSTVLSLVGATGSTTICYILPGLFYFKYREKMDPMGGKMDRMKVGSLLLAGVGVLIMSTSVTAQLIAIWNKDTSGSIPH